MGVDQFNLDDTQDYMEEGDIPVFMVYDQSENEFYDAKILNAITGTGYDFFATDFPQQKKTRKICEAIYDRVDYICFQNITSWSRLAGI